MTETRFIIDPDLQYPALLFKGEVVGFINKLVKGEASIQLIKQLSDEDRNLLSADVVSAVKFMPETIKAALFEAGNRAVNREAEKALALIPQEKRQRIELGGGFDGRPGFLNLDMRVRENSYDGETNCLTYDLRQGLPPLPAGSVEYIYSSHFLEHLTFEECLKVVTDSFTVLRSGGLFRAALPTAKRLVEDYVKREPAWLDEMKKSVVLLQRMPEYMQNFGDMLSCGIYQDYKHKYFYDEENISALLNHIGFQDVRIDEFDPEIDSEKRRQTSFYVTCRK